MTIDYGTACTRAVLSWPDGRWTPLSFDAGTELTSAVYVGDGQIVAGAAAWQHAGNDPDGFVVAPLRAATEQVSVRGVAVEVADLVAATLRHVLAQAQRVLGEPLRHVRLVVPASWGPRRRTWLRHACRRAGLPVTELIEAPVAALRAGGAAGSTPAPGTTILVIDVGAGSEATVVSYGPSGWEVLSTLADADAGGDRIDTALTATLTGSEDEHLPAGQRWMMLAALRTAKQSLTSQPAVTLPLPADRPPVVMTIASLHQSARPVLERTAALAATVVDNADLTLGQIDSVRVIGATAGIPAAGDMIAAKLGRAVQVDTHPDLAAVRGAAGMLGRIGPAPAPVGLPPLRRLLALGVSGLAALVVYTHFLLSAEFNNGTPQYRSEWYYVWAGWGELSVACVLVVVTAMQAAGLFTMLLEQQGPTDRLAERAPLRIGAGILAAAVASVATAGVLAVTAAVFFAQPISLLLRWALLPILPILAAALLLAWAGRALPHTPTHSWDAVLAFPASSVLAAAAGIAGVTLRWLGPPNPWFNDWFHPLGAIGGFLVGVAIACALVRHLAARLLLAVLIGFFTLIVSRSGPGIPAVIYALTVAFWYASRAWMVHRRGQTSGDRGGLATAAS
ncbi:Hsp70 family protein [Actinoplanes sp. CA-131856]